MKRPVLIAILTLLSFTLSGCGWIQPPRIVGPGPVAYQQHWATRFDPYPDDTYAPEVVGGRPRGFQFPVTKPEPARPLAQQVWLGYPGYPGSPVP